MKIVQKEIRYFIYSKGKIPFKEWLDSLQDIKGRAVINNRLIRVSLGNLGDCKYLSNEIYELRIHYGPGYRVYFGEIDNTIILLLCGGEKSSQNKDIKKAKGYWLEFKQ